MSLTFATLLLAQFAAPLDGEAAQRIEGRCTYPPALVEQAEDAMLVQCGEAVLTPEGIAFAGRGFAPTIAFRGEWEGDGLRVTQVARRGIEPVEDARGFCRFQLRQEELSAVVCSVVGGARSYLVNFLVPQLNNPL